MLRARPLIEFGDEFVQVRFGLGGQQVVGQVGERGERLPSLASRAARRRVVGVPGQRGQHPADGVWQRFVGVLRRSRRAAEQQPRLADLGAVEEPLATAQHVRHTRLGQRLLVHLGLRVHPEQHGDLGGRRAGLGQCPALRRDIGSLGGFVVVLGEGRVRAVRSLAGEGDPVVAHERVRQPDDLRCGPVVAMQPHHDGLRKATAEVQQVIRSRAGERVNRLVRVADDAHVVTAAEPRVEQSLLQG